MLKRIHGWSLIVGMLIALGLVGACSAWQKKQDNVRPANQSNVSNNNTSDVQNNESDSNRKKSKRNDNFDSASNATANAPSSSDYATIDFRSLPKEAQSVIGVIKARGGFPYRQDGQVFSNREHILPEQSKGYYREYTVVTPGADNRGARRIVAGSGKTGDVATSGEYYYTSDHYRTFSRVKE